MVHWDAVEDGGRREEQTIIECILRVESVSENNVCNLEGQNRVEVTHLLRTILRYDAGRVKQTFRDDNRVANSKRLKRLGQQRAAADRPGECDVVVGQNVASQCLGCLVELARCIDKTSLEKTLDDVVFCLLNPSALRTKRADILRVIADVSSAHDIDGCVFRLRWRNLQHITPDVINSFELECARDALRIALLN